MLVCGPIVAFIDAQASRSFARALMTDTASPVESDPSNLAPVSKAVTSQYSAAVPLRWCLPGLLASW
jgi:hypothetical protein